MKINELLEYLNKYGNIDEYDCYTFEKSLTLKFNDKIYKDVTSIAIENYKKEGYYVIIIYAHNDFNEINLKVRLDGEIIAYYDLVEFFLY